MRIWLLFVECTLWFVFSIYAILVKAQLRRCIAPAQRTKDTHHRPLILGAGIVAHNERRDRA